MSAKRFRANLIQEGVIVASVDAASQQECEREIRHYALIYGQDGPVRIERKWAEAMTTKERVRKPNKSVCPSCGLERDKKDAHVYICVQCDKEGFDCCVPGNHAICLECEEGER